jgi:hypothetical protein
MKFFSELVTLFFADTNFLGKLVGFVSDGAPTMIGRKNGVAAKL